MKIDYIRWHPQSWPTPKFCPAHADCDATIDEVKWFKCGARFSHFSSIVLSS